MATYQLEINGEQKSVEADADTPLLWVIRDHLKLDGTKYGCGIAQCGACTVHIDGTPIRSCVIPISRMEGKQVVTIEGLSEIGDHPVQEAWKDIDVPQCGYCQTGQIMSAAALLERIPQPTEEEIYRGMKGNVCRCGTYPRIVKAIKSVAKNQES
ncbi:MAG: (2Fe-2S)-binding protein [Reichenbachiella sp.]|uniref:(2Fe-2S)-binding protein n=1 Tax=Reichenbachiella sp. TaxID=2184521 RepID=UPI003296D349